MSSFYSDYNTTKHKFKNLKSTFPTNKNELIPQGFVFLETTFLHINFRTYRDILLYFCGLNFLYRTYEKFLVDVVILVTKTTYHNANNTL